MWSAMKILHVITGLKVGGAEMMLQRLIQAASDHSHVVVCLTAEGVVGADLIRRGVAVNALNIGGLWSLVTGCGKLSRLMTVERPDIVHCWMYHSNLIGGIVARASGVTKVVWGVRATDLPRTGSIKTRLVRSICALLSAAVPSRIIYAADVSRRLHEALGYSKRKSLVIPNGFDIDSLKAARGGRASMRARLGIQDGQPVIGCVGRFHDDKGPDVFLRAASLVRGVDRSVRFMMVGRKMSETNPVLMSWIADLGLTGSVLLLGERPDVPSCLAAMDVFCLPSRTEGFPNVVGEAMGAGLCCVVTDVGDAGHLLGGAGLVVPPDDPSALSAGLLGFVSMSAAERTAIGRSAQDRIEVQFSLKTVAATYSNFYQSL